ncbi:7,8-didemethyl-8-hydroxy-5-deazariboflavin synthase subunit CofG [bacterium]|nr:7,8-didemethyl-8-hydroxy-5-deazariboflavin synthase subunit CofG [bacterium]
MDKNIVTYSRSLTIDLTNVCSNQCDYCSFSINKLDQSSKEMLVPYSVIEMSQMAKHRGAKEINLVAGERPDKFAAIRDRLDQWGFHSFIEYVYTVAELVFLEGMLPSIELGSLNEQEIAFIRKIAVSMTQMIETTDERIIAKYSPNKTLNSRIDSIKNAGKNKLPVTTGILVGLGESLKSRKQAFELIKAIHEKYGNIQNVVIQNYMPIENTKISLKTGPSKNEMLRTIEQAKKILPADVVITVPAVWQKDVLSLVRLGVTDFGRFDVTTEKIKHVDLKKTLKEIEQKLKKKKLKLQHRLPIFSKYILNDWYSRKTAQVLDKYKLLLKQAEEKG